MDGPHHKDTFVATLLGFVFATLGSPAVLTGWTMGAATIYSGRCIMKRRRRMLSLVMAGIMCVFFPFGTALGVFTLVLLMRPSVTELYGEANRRTALETYAPRLDATNPTRKRARMPVTPSLARRVRMPGARTPPPNGLCRCYSTAS